MDAKAASQAALSQLVGHAFASLLTDVGRARGILHDAIPGLIKSFNGLRDDLSAQSTELVEVSRELQGKSGQKGFLENMRNVLDTFVQDLVKVSHNSMQLVERVEALGVDVTQIVTHVGEIESMAKATRLIALNARIEAHRAGDAGKTFRVVADEVKTLADEAAGFSGEIRDVVDRAHARLDEARIATVALASHDLNSVLEAQQGVMHTVERLGATNLRVTQSLERFHANVDAAIRALQFEDMLNQLLVSVEGRMGHVRDLWTTWLAVQGTNSEQAWRELDTLLARVKPHLERESTVQQQSMTTGTVELF
jgi:methyl-accepting chemotaxis protein